MPPRTPQPPTTVRRSWWLRRADQAVVAGLTLSLLVALAAYWTYRGGLRGRLIDIDEAPPLEAEFVVDINEAAWPELSQLPELGETLARRIVESREQDGDFLDHDDLRRVRGIGPATLEQIRPYLAPLPDASATAGDRGRQIGDGS